VRYETFTYWNLIKKKVFSSLLYHLNFKIGLTREASSMISEPMYWVQFPLTTYFLPLRVIIFTKLARVYT
jgi:hypothetical protein